MLQVLTNHSTCYTQDFLCEIHTQDRFYENHALTPWACGLMLEIMETRNLIAKLGSGVAQLVEWSLPTPDLHGSNPGIGKFYIPFPTCKCLETTNLKIKRPKMAHLKHRSVKQYLIAESFLDPSTIHRLRLKLRRSYFNCFGEL